MLNRAQIIGNLGRDPEFRTTPSGVGVCTLSVATTRKWKSKDGTPGEETEWHRVTVWDRTSDGGQATSCNKYLVKGSKVYVEGRLKTTSYEKEGVKKYSTEIVSERVQFLDKKGDDPSVNAPDAPKSSAETPTVDYDEIPF